MKTLKIKIFYFLSFILLFAACETDIEFNGNESAPMMVMNSRLSPDSIIKVHISKSIFFLSNETEFENIDNATVTVYVNNNLQEQLSNIGDGIYTGNYIPQVNDTVKITASNNVFSEIYSTVTIQEPINIISIDTISKSVEIIPSLGYENGAVVDTFGYTIFRELQFKIKFQDAPDTKNYYRIVLNMKTLFEDSTVTITNSYFSSEDIVFGSVSENDIFGGGFSQSLYNEFNDELIESEIYELTLSKFFNGYYPNEKYDNDPYKDEDTFNNIIKSELIVELQSISESMYYSLKTKSISNDGIEFFSEPVQIYNNITGGIGLLESYSKSTYNIEIPLSYTPNYGYYSY